MLEDEDIPAPSGAPVADPPPARAAAGGDGVPLPQRFYATAAMCFGNALLILDGSIATVALPTIARDLHVRPSAAVLVVTTYQLVLVMTLLPFAALGERIGLRRVYQLGQIVFTAGTLLCFFARSLPFLIVVRAAQSLGASAALSVSSALVRSIYPARLLGRGLGLNAVVVSSAAAFAPTIGGLVLAVAPWPFVFATAAPLGIVSLLLGRALPDPRPAGDEPYDVLGAVMCAATFGLVISGLEAAVHGDSPVVAAAIAATGLGVGVFFIRRELGHPRPILPVDLLKAPIFALSTVGAFTAFVSSMTVIISLPFRLQHAYGYTPSQVGAVMAAWPMTSLFTAPTAGMLSDRVPAGILGGLGMGSAVVALLLIANLPPHPTYFDLAWRLALTGFGFGLFLSPNARLIIGSAPRTRTAAAGGLTSTTRMVGQAFGATLVAALLALGLGDGRMPPLISAALAAVAGICSVAGLGPTLRLRREAAARAAVGAR